MALKTIRPSTTCIYKVKLEGTVDLASGIYFGIWAGNMVRLIEDPLNNPNPTQFENIFVEPGARNSVKCMLKVDSNNKAIIIY